MGGAALCRDLDEHAQVQDREDRLQDTAGRASDAAGRPWKDPVFPVVVIVSVGISPSPCFVAPRGSPSDFFNNIDPKRSFAVAHFIENLRNSPINARRLLPFAEVPACRGGDSTAAIRRDPAPD